MTDDIAWSVLAALAMLAGLVGVVVPVLPGLVIIWVAALLYGLMVGFGVVGIVAMVMLTALLAASFVLGVVLPKRGASASGASTLAQVGGLIGAVVGFFVIPIVGLVVGALVGVIAVELAAKRNWPEAWQATKGVAKGFGKSVLADLGIGVVMMATWSIWAITVLF